MNNFKLSDYDYKIPQELIAQEPLLKRDESRLLIVDRKDASLKEVVFKDVVGLLERGDVLVLNDTKVFKARLFGRRGESKVEILLLKEKEQGIWEVLVKPGKRAKIGDRISFDEGFSAEILDKTPQGGRLMQFSSPNLENLLEKQCKVPLPHYIKKDVDDESSYQTVYAKKTGAVAAPTAGLHFTPELIEKIKQKGVEVVHITLHCGLATFRPIKTEDIRQHNMESEFIEISQRSADSINQAKKKKSRVVAVGTTSIRSLESAALDTNPATIRPYCSDTDLYIVPGYSFRMVDTVITNFHTPCSTNLVLLSSFCGQKLLKKAYDYAVDKKFRFYSFGDAMIVL